MWDDECKDEVVIVYLNVENEYVESMFVYILLL